MRDLLVTAIVFAAVPVAMFDPFVGIALWTWLSVMNPHRLTWSFAYSFPFAQAAALATFIGLIIGYRKVRFPVMPVTLAVIAFLVWTTITFLLAIHFEGSQDMWSRVTKTLVMTLVAFAVVRTERQMRIFLWIFVLSVAFFGFKGGIFAIVTGGENRVYGPPESMIEDNNAISVALVMMIPLLWFLSHQTSRLRVKLGLQGTMVLSALAVVASYSRGAFVAGSAMLMFLALKSRRRVLLIGLMGVSIPFVLAMMPEKWWDRMATITSTNVDSSVAGRFNAWHMIWNLAKDHPIFGGGFDIYEPDLFAQYAPNPADLHSAHSIYFQMLGEHGFVGLALFLLIALLTWRMGTRVIRNATSPNDLWRADLARALQVSMVGFFVGGLTVNIGYWDVYYFEIVLMVALLRLPSQAVAPALGTKVTNASADVALPASEPTARGRMGASIR